MDQSGIYGYRSLTFAVISRYYKSSKAFCDCDPKTWGSHHFPVPNRMQLLLGLDHSHSHSQNTLKFVFKVQIANCRKAGQMTYDIFFTCLKNQTCKQQKCMPPITVINPL